MANINVRQATLDFENPVTRARIEKSIGDTLAKSFALWPMPISNSPTDAEVKRRFTLLFEGYRVLRNEQGLSITRCLDNLLNILRADLEKDESALRNHSRTSWYAG